jgi:hypothetical protein
MFITILCAVMLIAGIYLAFFLPNGGGDYNFGGMVEGVFGLALIVISILIYGGVHWW